MTTGTQSVNLSVSPLSCLHDELIHITVDGLAPHQDVTLQASMKDTRNVHYVSTAHYKSDANGRVDVDTMESYGGHYKGVFPMGLVGTLLPAPGEYKYTRFFKRDVENPNLVDISVYADHLTDDELCKSEYAPLSRVEHQRHYMAPGVQRIPVRYGKVRGCLFLPPGDGPFPGVIDMFGSAGGLLEYRSAQLASRGIASLALAFFAYDDLPKMLEEFNIEYFEEAVEFLLKHNKIIKPHIGTVGVSKGGDLVLTLATFIPEVKAAVWINGCNASVQSSMRLKDSVLPGLEFDLGRVKIKDGIMDCYETVDNPEAFPDTIIPIEKADADFLFLVGLDDKNWKSEVYADQAVARLKKFGKNNFEVHKFPGAGHLIEPPQSPYCFASYHKLVRMPMLWGGQTMPHLLAQPKAWSIMLNFFRNRLR